MKLNKISAFLLGLALGMATNFCIPIIVTRLAASTPNEILMVLLGCMTLVGFVNHILGLREELFFSRFVP